MRAAGERLRRAVLALMAEAGIVVNLVFMFLNLFPILPLDGGRIVASLLPSRAAWRVSRKLEPLGLPILLVLLLVTNVLELSCSGRWSTPRTRIDSRCSCF